MQCICNHSPSSEGTHGLLDRWWRCNNLLPQHIAGLEAADRCSLDAAGSCPGSWKEESRCHSCQRLARARSFKLDLLEGLDGAVCMLSSLCGMMVTLFVAPGESSASKLPHPPRPANLILVVHVFTVNLGQDPSFSSAITSRVFYPGRIFGIYPPSSDCVLCTDGVAWKSALL